MTPLVIANFPAAALFVLAWVGIPLWMVLRHPDKQPEFSDARAYYRAKAELNQAEALSQRVPASQHEAATADRSRSGRAADPASTAPSPSRPVARIG